jgi:hypothetical protein
MRDHLKQGGMSSLALLFLLIVVIFLGTFAFRAVPMYYSHYMLEQTVANIDNPVGALHRMTNAEIREALNRNLAINAIQLDARQIDIQKSGTSTRLHYEYETRAPLFHNLGIVGSFTLDYSSGN